MRLSFFLAIVVLIPFRPAYGSDSPATGAPSVVPDPTPTGSIHYINPDIPEVRRPIYPGQRYQAWVPATFDLAERARLSVNALTRMLNPASDYFPYFMVFLMAEPPMFIHYPVEYGMQEIYFEALTLARTICGSDQNLDVEYEVMKNFLKMRGPDGLLYYPNTGRPWMLPEGNSQKELKQIPNPIDCGLIGLCIYARLDPSGPWHEFAKTHANWLKTKTRSRIQGFYGAPESRPIGGGAGPVHVIQLFQYGRAMNDPEAIELARTHVRYCLRDAKMYAGDGTWLTDWPNEPNGQPGGQASMAHCGARACVISYAMQIIGTEDEELLGLALKAYDYGVSRMESLSGFIPEAPFIPSEEQVQAGYRATEALPSPINYWGIPEMTMEICGLVGMIHAAVEFSKRGIDKWDDVDRWVRNGLAENQLTQVQWLTDGRLDHSEVQWQDRFLDLIKRGWNTTDQVAERCLGSWGGVSSVNDFVGRPGDTGITGQNCCSAAGARALYHVWRDMLSFDDGQLRVHLLLNRASKWADIDSHIPYTGRVDVRAKQDLDLEIRLPEWVKPEESRCEVDGRARKLTFDGRYAIVGGIREGQTAILNFPIVERTDKIRVQGRDYTIIRRGNEVVWMDPPGKYNPHYQQRGHYRNGPTLYRKVTRYVPEHTYDWW